MRIVVAAVVLVTGVFFVAAADDAVQRLGDIKKIYVASLGTAEGADVIREKIISRFVKSGKIVVVESAEEADATLTGIAERSEGVRYAATNGAYGGSASGGTTYSANVVVRLVGRSKQILWTGEATPRLFGSRSVSSNVADKMVKDILKAIEKAKGK
jgi:hypothetical protein